MREEQLLHQPEPMAVCDSPWYILESSFLLTSGSRLGVLQRVKEIIIQIWITRQEKSGGYLNKSHSRCVKDKNQQCKASGTQSGSGDRCEPRRPALRARPPLRPSGRQFSAWFTVGSSAGRAPRAPQRAHDMAAPHRLSRQTPPGRHPGPVPRRGSCNRAPAACSGSA